MPPRPTLTERMAINPSVNTDAPTARAAKDTGIPPGSTQPQQDQQHRTIETHPASLPSRPHFLHDLPPAPKFEIPGMAFPPTPPASINPALICGQQGVAFQTHGLASLPPRPPSPLHPYPSRFSFQPGVPPVPNTLLNSTPSYLANSTPSYLAYSTPSYLANNTPSVLPASTHNSLVDSLPNSLTPSYSNRTTHGLHFTMNPQLDLPQVDTQPSGLLSAIPGTGATLTLPRMDPYPVMEAYSETSPSRPDQPPYQPPYQPWDMSTWDQSFQAWDPSFDP